ncbi:MAG: LmeA family phospholipid-binding protein [Rhodoglobus sp.]
MIAGTIIAVLVIASVIIVETVGRAAAERLVRAEIATALGITTVTSVDVDLGPGSLIVQAITGGIDEVTITADHFEVNGLTASVRLVATDVPLIQTEPLNTLSLQIAIPGGEVSKLAATLSGLELDSIALQTDTIRVSTVLSLAFISIPVAVDLLPVVAAGSLGFEPQSIVLADQNISVPDLRNNPLLSGVAGTLLSTQTFCVASAMPAALTIDSAAIRNNELIVELSADHIALGDARWQQFGSCPAA